jgi:FkbM family methyltransferase
MSYPESTSCGEIGCILHIILNNVLSYKTNGTFIEVGANDGKTGSFTYNLAELGWYGLNFEPVPRLYNECCLNHQNHKNVKNFQLGLGETSKEAIIIDANTLSTIDSDIIETYTNTSQFSSYFNNNNISHKIKIEKLDTVLESNYINDVDLLIIDVEGYEENVLKGFTIQKYIPSIVIIEICDQHPDFINNKKMMDKYKVLRQYFIENNYTLLVNDIVDNVYIHNNIYSTLNPTFIDYIKSLVNFSQFVHEK